MKLADLKLNPDNPRNIKPEKLDKLAQSIKDFPKMMVKRPIVYDENKVIIGGNMRYKAIEKLGMTEIPDEWTSDASDFTPEERKRFIMQDNAEMGEHDWDMVANQYELEDLDAWGIDVPYADVEEEVEEDEAPEVSSEPPVSELGKIYQLGRHRVMCGDSTDKANVELLMNGAKADMVFTDPPYGIGYKSNAWDSTKQSVKAKRTDEVIANDSNTDIGILGVEVSLNSVKADSHYYIWCRWDCYQDFKAVCQQLGTIKSVIVWDKGAAMGLGDLKGSYADSEWAIFGMIGRKELNNRENSVWQVNRMKGLQMQHPTQKPIELPARAIQNSSKSGDMVLDLFLGSGSTLIACEQTDRTCYGMELDPKYVDVIRKRYAKFVSPDNTLPENWEELTPEIAREKRGE